MLLTQVSLCDGQGTHQPVLAIPQLALATLPPAQVLSLTQHSFMAVDICTLISLCYTLVQLHVSSSLGLSPLQCLHSGVLPLQM